MALTDENGGMNATMLMQPAYGIPYGGGFGGGYGMGGDFMSWIILILLLGGNWGGFGMGGAMMGAGMMGMDMGFCLYPWMNQVNQMNDGFRDQQLSTQVSSIQSAIQSLASQLCECCGNMRYDMSQGFNGVERSVTGAQTALAQQMYANQIADMERSYAAQTATAQGFNGVQAGLSDIRYTTAKEACDTRSQAAMNTRDIVDAIRGGDQMIMDKLCALELDGVKSQLAQAQRENVGLQNQVNMATFRESQAAQNAFIAQEINQQNEVFYNRLKNCPVNAVPVAGNTPLFTCNPSFNTPNGCGCNGFNG